MKKKILIVVAHPDDETFGMAGTIAKHISERNKVLAISFTDGVSSRDKGRLTYKSRIASLKKAEKILGFKWVKNLDFEDNQLDKVGLLKLAKEIEKIKKKIKFDIVYTHNYSDLNIDHQLVSRATLTAFRPENKIKNPEIRFFEIPSSTDFASYKIDGSFKPNLFINITKFWKKKIKAVKAYRQELRKKPHSLSLSGITNLAKLRGSQSSKLYSEAFEIVRKIEE